MLDNTIRSHHLALIGARVLWIVSTLMSLLYLVAGVPSLVTYYESACEVQPLAVCTVMETGLRSLGLHWRFYGWYNAFAIAIAFIPLFSLCSLLAWRKKDDPKTLLFLVALMLALTMNVNYSLPDVIIESYPDARIGVFFLAYLGQISPMMFYMFPDGHFVPRWTRWLAAGFAVLHLVVEFNYRWLSPSAGQPSDLIKFILWIVFPLTLAYALLYRYRKAASPEQRQQIKWIVWSLAANSVLFVVDPMVSLTGSWFGWDISIPIGYSIYQALGSPTISYIAVVLGSLGFYAAIFQSHLWDVDFFINRSLVYGGLTILLGAVLLGVFVATQALLGIMVTTMQAGAAGLVSAIVVIVLFAPVRDRLQRFVDSRFYGVDPSHQRAVQAAIAQERDRLSRDLHDSVTQSLYGLTIMAESCQRLIHEEEVKRPLAEMGEVARQALKEMRLLIYELRPPVLKEEGLLGALHQRLAAVEKRSGIEASLVVDEVVDLPVVIEEVLYSIAIEALNNAIKHAAARSVGLSLHTGDGWVEMAIADDGQGFDPASHGRNDEMGLGLAGMRKRVEELGGTLTIYSTPVKGTIVTARIAYHSSDFYRQLRKSFVRSNPRDSRP